MAATVERSKCGRDVYMPGSRICPVCDPNIDDLLSGGKKKTPNLCDGCFKKHEAEHKIMKES